MTAIHPLLPDLEGVERRAWQDLARAFPGPLGQALGLEVDEIGGALFLLVSKLPVFQFNWLAGAGLGGDGGDSIAEAVRRFRRAGQRKFFVQIPPGPNARACEARAREAGLVEHPLAWAKFCRPTAGAPVASTPLDIREVGPDDRDLFGSTGIAAFGMPPALAPWLSQIVGRPGWHAYLSFSGTEPAGAAALYADGDLAWLGIGATRPEMRRRGGQSALLARRIADAGRLGASYAVTETGVPQPGQPAPSHANILRAGFEVAYVRPNWTERGG
jgi:GNAT superfamily N-acetyltransferase